MAETKPRAKRAGIVARISVAFGLLVFCTAIIVYIGSDARTSRLYSSQRRARVEFLARSMSYGIENLLVSSGSKEQIAQVADDVLKHVMAADSYITGCRIINRKGDVIYTFSMLGIEEENTSEYVSMDVKSENLSIGTIRLYYNMETVFENEKNRQVVVLGNTVASMIRHYVIKADFFQVKFLSKRIIEADPDVLYASVTGPDGSRIYEYRTSHFDSYLTEDIVGRSMMVNMVQPVTVQEIGVSRRYGRMVEVSVLIEDAGNRIGVVRIGYSTGSLVRTLARERLLLSLVIIGFTFLAFGVALFLAGNITRPLAELTRLARSMGNRNGDGAKQAVEDAEEDLNRLRVEFDRIGERLTARGDEVADLAIAFQDMIDNLIGRIRELKTFYRQISVADRFYAMGQLSSGIAHEINNPLTIVSTYVQLILKRPDLNDETRFEVETIREEIDRIAEKVKDLLSFAQESKYEFAVSDVHALLRKSLELTRHQFRKNGIALEEKFCREEQLMVKMDPRKFRQVILNLILNAVQAMTDSVERKLSVGTVVSDDSDIVEIFFRDTGCGIPRDYLDRIYDPFFTTKKTGVGTGLGLSISYNIVTAHKGEMRVESEPGEGAVFRILLPKE